MFNEHKSIKSGQRRVGSQRAQINRYYRVREQVRTTRNDRKITSFHQLTQHIKLIA